ncbi:hypothetical protein M427DRAFT_51873 [Gonapodya prolifera JEL478]|uniref:Uncharacterized protein n=1 Tax=Gonapodya prolifera (strain JEL478) TaxID=1344416 RepID=A0A139AW38_GONPJ|nr:hypothetical protein M427DRAFT_51873 [Gonapodya prolifera JEL478]|eukprot:KXS20919.1 hypothetical protein M427DRAFT_51873 [Gonapodya prolifera JEL478]
MAMIPAVPMVTCDCKALEVKGKRFIHGCVPYHFSTTLLPGSGTRLCAHHPCNSGRT